jgi:thiol:disulfide interchange protein
LSKSFGISIFFLLAVAGCQMPSGEGIFGALYHPTLQNPEIPSGKPSAVYFFTDWCPYCKRMEKNTFSDPRVTAALEPYRKIRVDMTDTRSAETRSHASHFGITSFPAVLFFDSRGREIPGFRIVGYVSAAQFLDTLEKLEKYPA